MATWKPLVLILAIIIIGVAAFFYFTKPNSTPSSPTSTGFGQPAQNVPTQNEMLSPDAFAIGFYTWYLQGLMNDQGFNSSDQFQSTIGSWLTQDFANNWNTLSENTGSDPVLLAQDYQNSWITNIQAVVVNQTSTASTVIVSLGVAQELHQINVLLIQINGKWRIYSITSAL